jgi:hypothetical protein
MDHCGPYQAHLLDYLYDLLEGEEHQSLQQHLNRCADCQAALRAARGQQQMLAAAARMEFPGVRFEAPEEVLPFAQRPAARPARPWGRWVAAAALVAAVVGLGGAGGLSAVDYARARQSRDAVDSRMAAASQAVAKTELELREAREKRDNSKAGLINATQDRQLKVVVSGPETVQPGAPNEFHIETRDPQMGQPVPARLTVRLRDQARRVLAERNEVVSTGDYRLDLPPNLEVKPNARLSLQILARRDGVAGAEQVEEDLPVAEPVYVTHLAIDRPLYRPGETVFFRSLTLERFTMRPPEEDFQLIFKVRKPDRTEENLGTFLSRVGAKQGDQFVLATGPTGVPLHGIGAGEYHIDPQAPGGEWVLKVSEAHNRFPPQERRFLVNRYEPQNLSKELEWSKRSYGPGEEVVAHCQVETADHRKVRCHVQATVLIDRDSYGPDGRPGQPFHLDTDADGKVAIAFRLPEHLDPGAGTLSVMFSVPGGSIETIDKPIPIVVNKLNVDFYPEGGDLVAGASNRVYFQVHSTLGKPADLRGRLIDDAGRIVKEGIETFRVSDQPGANLGMGVFEFTPEAGRTYELKIAEPAGIEGKHVLPAAKTDGVALSIPTGVTKSGEPIRAVVRNAGPERSLLVGAYCRGRLMAHQDVTVKRGEAATVDLKPTAEIGGVYRVTVFEDVAGAGDRHTLRPLAERLVYRRPAQELKLAVRPDQRQYVPGAPVRLEITSNASWAVALVAVVDKSVFSLADDKTARSMPTHFFLASEVRKPEELEHADFLLAPVPEAGTALDLLLGTQGWRRFAEQHPEQFRKAEPLAAERLFVSDGEARKVDFLQRDLAKVQEEYNKEAVALSKRLGGEQDAEKAAREGLRGEVYKQARDRVAMYEGYVHRLRNEILPQLGVVLLLVALGALIVAAARNSLRAGSLGVGALACSLVLLVGLAIEVGLATPNPHPFTKGPELGQGGFAIADHRPEPTAQPNPVAPRAPGGHRMGPLGFNAGQGGAHFLPADKHAQPNPPPTGPAPAKFEDPALERALKHLADVNVPVPPPPSPCVVREYAHQHEAGTRPEVRTDFAETLYWNPVLILRDGTGTVSFQLSDSVTSYQVAVMGNTFDGRLGAVTSTLDARLPLSVAPKVPTEVSSTDQIEIPVSIANNTAQPRDVDLQVIATGLIPRERRTKGLGRLTVAAGEHRRSVFRFRPDVVEGEASVEVRGEAGPGAADSIRRTFAVVPEGFPVVASHSDMLEKSSTQQVVLPKTWVKGTLGLKAEVFPSTLADLQKGLEALLHEPGGCFEQTSSSNYPNLLILDCLKETDQAKPEVRDRALAMLDRGYQQLTRFECPYGGQERHGYEWFGAPNAAHEALTAYGLLEFHDMARVTKVDPAMLERTRKYLLDQRDGRGGFKRNPHALDTFGRAPQDVTNAYILWALTETGKTDDLTKELNALAEQAKGSADPYFLALVANSLLNQDRADEAVALLKKVAGRQQEDGHLEAARTSITGSGGRPLQVETTALAVFGWLKANRPGEFNAPVQKAVRWIGRQRGDLGGFGSTQSTILALKALIAFTRANKKTAEAGELRLVVGDAVVARTTFPAGVQDALTLNLPEPQKHLHPGKNEVRVEMTGDKNVFPCTVSWSYRTLQPPGAADAPVRLATRLDRTTADEGDTVQLTVTVENPRAEGQGMAVAVIGLPAGLALPEDLKQLKQHAELRNHGTERGPIDFFEVRGRELVLYWRDLAPRQKIEVPVNLICRVPGVYRGPASRAYLYYNNDARCWVDPLQVTIWAKE